MLQLAVFDYLCRVLANGVFEIATFWYCETYKPICGEKFARKVGSYESLSYFILVVLVSRENDNEIMNTSIGLSESLVVLLARMMTASQWVLNPLIFDQISCKTASEFSITPSQLEKSFRLMVKLEEGMFASSKQPIYPILHDS